MESCTERFFVMAHQLPGLWQGLLRDRVVRPVDLTTWHVLQQHVIPALGAVVLSPEHLGGLYGLSGSHMAHSIGRLRKALLVATWRDPRTKQRMLVLNPHVASMGNSQRRGWIWARFCEATDGRAAAVFTERAMALWAVDESTRAAHQLDNTPATM
jgi:hypothetical protein